MCERPSYLCTKEKVQREKRKSGGKEKREERKRREETVKEYMGKRVLLVIVHKILHDMLNKLVNVIK